MTLLRGLVLLLFMAGAAITVLAGEGKAPEGSPNPAASETANSETGGRRTEAGAGENACLTDPSVIADIRAQREVLQAREREIAAKEAELKAREEAVADELKKFDAIRKDISKVEGAKKAENDERVNKLVETFSNMSPKGAAQLFTNLDETLAVAVMSRLEPQRLGKIMNSMEPAKASRLTELLAGVVRASKSSPASAPAMAPVKGKDSSASDGAAETAEKRKGGEST